MPRVCVHGALRQLAGGAGEHELQAATVLELLRELEREHPALGGWIVGERGGEGTAVAADARVEILPAITGG